MKDRNILLDVLKGIAIIAVILYHCHVLTYGYLGVEVFLVIGGYLITNSIIKQEEKGVFSYWSFLNNRFVRLWPLLILVSAISLGLGWIWHLPQTLKMTSESAIASVLFVNNLVQYITSGDYWSSGNDYYPLMHTWYIGVMMQFYLIYPLVYILSRKFSNDFRKGVSKTLGGVFIVSLCLYCLPVFDTSQNFYLLPSRLFEFAAGGLIAISNKELYSGKCEKYVIGIGGIVLFILLAINSDMEVTKWRLLTTVALTSVFVYLTKNGTSIPVNKVTKMIALCGTASYSLYLCHQPILALYRYTINDLFTIETYFVLVVISFVVGFTAYYLIEKPLNKFVKGNFKHVYLMNGISLILVMLLAIPALYGYKKQGLVRDLPEFEMFVGKNSPSPMDYNSRTWQYDMDFEQNGRKNVLVVGDSFGRDFVNILLESGVDSLMNISYHTDFDDALKRRINTADYIFVASIYEMNTKYPDFASYAHGKKLYRVGNKSFGSCIGILYNNDRYGRNYYKQTVVENDKYMGFNKKEKELYAENFIDMMDILKDKEGNIPVFYGNRFITQDGLHITHAGAQMYAEKLNIKKYLK